MTTTLTRLLVATLLAVCIVSCAALGSKHKKVLVLDYQDFGPQVIAREVLGMEWWQWQAHGDSSPTARYDVKVAVYRDAQLDEVKKEYPVLPERQQDVRYLEHGKALHFLDEKIQENALESVTERLRATKKKITDWFGR